MAFQKGMTKLGGRKLGVQNQATIEIKDFSRSILEDTSYQTKLRQRIIDGDAPQIEQLLYHYGYGRPKTELEVNRRSINVIVDRSAGRTEKPVDIPAVALPEEAD